MTGNMEKLDAFFKAGRCEIQDEGAVHRAIKVNGHYSYKFLYDDTSSTLYGTRIDLSNKVPPHMGKYPVETVLSKDLNWLEDMLKSEMGRTVKGKEV